MANLILESLATASAANSANQTNMTKQHDFISVLRYGRQSKPSDGLMECLWL